MFDYCNVMSHLAPTRQKIAVSLAIVAGALSFAAATPVAEAKSKARSAKVVTNPDRPLLINVSISRQRLTVYDGDKVIATAPVSTGQRGHRTPRGIFSVLQKRRHHYSNLYAGAPMPYMQRITWSGIALHAGHLPGYPASHGCIRMPYSFARKLFKITDMAERVIVSRAPVKPRLFTHAFLPKPLPPGDPAEAFASLGLVHGPTPVLRDHDTVGSMQLIMSATAAHASPRPDPVSKPRTRALVAAEMAAQISQLSTSVGEAKDEVKASAKRLTLSKQSVETHRANLKQAMREAGALKREIKTADRRVSAFKSKLAALMKRYRNVVDDAVLDTVSLEEDKLEALILDHSAAGLVARAEAAGVSKIVANDIDAVKKAEAHQKAMRVARADAKVALIDAKNALKAAKRAHKRFEKPITIFVSRKAMRMFVRQGYDPLFDLPVEIKEPAAKIGTHIYQAYSFTDDKADLIWHAASVDTYAQRKKKRRKWRKGKRRSKTQTVEQSPRRPVPTTTSALERVTISDEARTMIAELLKPGSTLIISDEKVGNETGKYTDIIVQTR